MRKILGLAVSALLIMGLVGGGTWAFFSDTETSTGNTLAAGTLNLGLDTASGQNPEGSITDTFDAANWAPGDTVTNTIYVNNEGTASMSAVKLSITHGGIVDFPSSANITAGPGGDTDVYDKMITATTATWNGTSVSGFEGLTLFDLNSTGNITLGSLPANDEVPLEILWTFNGSATNGCQGDSLDLTLTFSAES